MTLQEAITQIENRFPFCNVVMIEFEDGSGMKFNFRLGGDKENRFINLTPKTNEFVGRFMEAKKIMDKWTK